MFDHPTLAALTALAICCAPALARAEPPGACGWEFYVDEPERAVPIDRPVLLRAEHLTAWNCDKGLAPIGVLVLDESGEQVGGEWSFDEGRGLLAWAPDGGWPHAGEFSMSLFYSLRIGDRVLPSQLDLRLLVGDALPSDGYDIALDAPVTVGEESPIVRCCDDREQGCWVRSCDTHLTTTLAWSATDPDGQPLPAAVWYGVQVEEAETPDEAPRVRWAGQGRAGFSLRLSRLPTCVRVQLRMLPEDRPLAVSPWRCLSDFELVGPSCAVEEPLACGEPEPEPEGEPEPPPEPEPQAEPEPMPGPEPSADAGRDADGGAPAEGGEAPASGRDSCAIAAPGRVPGAGWAWLLLLALPARRRFTAWARTAGRWPDRAHRRRG